MVDYISEKFKGIIEDAAKVYINKKLYECRIDKLDSVAIKGAKNPELSEILADGISRVTEEKLGFSIIATDEIDRLFDKYFTGSIAINNRADVKEDFEKYMYNVDQILNKEMDTAQRLIYKSIGSLDNSVNKKITQESNRICKSVDGLKAEMIETSNRTKSILEKLDKAKEPLIGFSDAQRIMIIQRDETEKKFNLYDNTVVLDQSLDELERHTYSFCFSIDIYISNIGAVTIDNVDLLSLAISFYETESENYSCYKIVDFKETVRFYKTILPNSTAKLVFIANDNKIDDDVIQQFYDGEDTSGNVDFGDYCENVRNNLSRFSDIIIEFCIQINESLTYDITIYAEKTTNKDDYLIGNYKVNNIVVGLQN